MSFRALWIITHEKGENATVRFSRRFATVEHRAKRLGGSLYVAVPEDSSVLRLLLTELGLSDPHKPFVLLRDDCRRCPKTPAYELRVGPGQETLWPVVVITHGPVIVACLGLVDVPLEPRPPMANLLCVSQGITFLIGLQNFLVGSGGKLDNEVMASRLAMLPSVLLQVCPLGTPLDVPSVRVPATSSVSAPAGSQKHPAWKTGFHRGRAVVNAALTETVRSMQYGDPSKQDTWDVYGTVMCKCEVEGVLPDVTLTLTLPPNGSPLQDILVHHCVTSLDSSILTACSVDNYDGSSFSGPYKFPFTPPLEPFRLCGYTSQVPVPPILGSYQLKEEDKLLLVSATLKLHESVKNSFEYCEAHLPFFNRPQMTFVDVKVSSGHVDVSKEKNLLAWVLGQKFPKSREVTMEGRISFSGPAAGPTDPVCTELTAYIKLYFKVPDTTLSGCCVDQNSVQVYSSTKPKITTSRELKSKDYYIWNSTSPAPICQMSL
ncbi:AP-5 complex subunit mu-1 [Corythoichthys intestinalis]|uniref:AP-5 complex subunit mu-1 n=1 Tax=Corythoichthys intestinalis TaxID=161448 RepID=UPI0025A5170B|nr:AP-5 complex subunit mu-1 [Corythoichthys intestinalis]XP_061798045.1 AP-5 complex subunit mu-1-like [Nerophis lumbriciformis]